jgi:hypothetical protein
MNSNTPDQNNAEKYPKAKMLIWGKCDDFSDYPDIKVHF